MKKNLVSLVSLVCLVGLVSLTSCKKENTQGNGTQFRATMEDCNAAKTELNGTALEWVSGDQIAVYGTAGCGIYSATPQTPATTAVFDNVSGETGDSPFRAFYPTTLTTDGVNITLPATQTYVEGSINQFPMYAESSNDQLTFKNLCGVLALNLTKANINISSITITANSAVNGTFAVDNTTGTPILSDGNGTNTVTLNCATAQSISSGKVFYVALPATRVLGISMYTDDGRVCEKAVKSTVQLTVERNTITTVEFEDEDMEFVRIMSGGQHAPVTLLPTSCNYSYSYTQQLLLSSELSGAAVVTGIDFYLESTTSASRNLEIYLTNTTTSSLYGGFVPYDNTTFVQVLDGYLFFTTGWCHIEFDTPFTYDGTSNLLITVRDKTGAYGSSKNFRVHSVTGQLSRAARSDATDYNPATITTTTGSYYNYRCDMRLHYDDSAK